MIEEEIDPVEYLDRLILIHWEKIEPNGEKPTSEEKFSRLQWVLERYGICLEHARGRELTSDEIWSLLDRLLGVYDLSPGSNPLKSLECLLEFYRQGFGDDRGGTEP